MKFLHRLESWNDGRRVFELRLLLPMLALSVLVWGFLMLANEVAEGDSHAIDRWVLVHLRTEDLRPLGGPQLAEIARDLTALGSTAVLVMVSATAWLTLMVAKRRRMAWIALASALSGVVMSILLKQSFSRSRPEDIFHATLVSGYSFPSGHAMMSAVVYLTLAALIARLTTSASLRVCTMIVAVVITGVVGATRIYLGVHWMSDVVAGWIAGATWAVVSWLVAGHFGVDSGGPKCGNMPTSQP